MERSFPSPPCMLLLLVLCGSALSVPQVAAAGSLDIAAFNIQIFGRAKMAKPAVVTVLVETIRTFDLTLIQEIRDSSETEIFNLLQQVNAAGPSTYEVIVSARTGRSTSKEQYAFMYRTDRLNVTTAYEYADPGDIFAREPFLVEFEVRELEKKFFAIPVHITPDDAVAEITALKEVYEDGVRKFENIYAIIMGDLNADCSYVTQTDFETLPLYLDAGFSWLIDHSVDTTTSATDCAYDRFIVNSPLLPVMSSSRIFNFTAVYNLTEELTKDVSDHYPIQTVFDVDQFQALPVVSQLAESSPGTFLRTSCFSSAFLSLVVSALFL